VGKVPTDLRYPRHEYRSVRQPAGCVTKALELCVRSQSRTSLKGVVLRFGTGHLAVAEAVAGASCLHKSAKASGIIPTRKLSDNLTLSRRTFSKPIRRIECRVSGIES